MPASRPAPIVLTRAPEDNAELARRLRSRGFEVLEWPAIATRTVAPPGGAAALEAALGRAQVVMFTSRRGVVSADELLGGRLAQVAAGRDVYCVGPGTGATLAGLGLEPHVPPGDSGAAALASSHAALATPGARMLLVRGALGEDLIPQMFEHAGLVVEDLKIYEHVEPPRPDAHEQPLLAIVVASPSAARQIVEWFPWASSATFVAIGGTTAAELKRLGAPHVRVSRAADIDGLEEAVLLVAEGARR